MPRNNIPAFLPMQVDTAIEAETRFVSYDSGLMTTMGLRGQELGTGEPISWVGCDVPTLARSSMTKEAQELRDVEAALAHLLGGATGPHLVSVMPGPDPNQPPDVIATLSDGPLACETFQLHMPSLGPNNNVAISRQTRFEKLRQDLMGRAAKLTSKTRKHKGFVVYVWFGDPGDPANDRLPDRDAQRLIALLEATSPPTSVGPSWKSSSSQPTGNVAWNQDHTMGLTWSSVPAAYRSAFLTSLHFELALTYGYSVRESDINDELTRLANQHDSPVTDLLVVTVNASYRSGLYFPSSKVLADMVFDAHEPLAGRIPQHLQRIVVHDPAKPGRVRWLLGSGIR